MDVGGVAPLDGLPSLFRRLKFSSSSAVQELIAQQYAELKESYEAQERKTPEYAVDQDEEVKQACKEASLLFIARVLCVKRQNPEEQGSQNLGCSISRLVTAAGVNLLDFFRELNVVVSKLSPYFEARGSSSKLFIQMAQLKEHSDTMVVMALIAKKYKNNFNVFLNQLDMYKQVVLRLGWHAFLVLRVRLLSAFPDVVSCMELLPCIFAILAAHCPRTPDCLSHIKQEDRGTLLLKTMSEIIDCKADVNRVRARMPAVQALLLQILTAAVPEWRAAVTQVKSEAVVSAASATASAAALGAGTLDLVATPVLEGLVTDLDRMNRAAAALEREYEQHYSRGGLEIDERELLTIDFTKFASPRCSPGHMHSAAVAAARLRGMSTPMSIRPGALLGPGAHTTAPLHLGMQQALLMPQEMPPGMHSPLPVMHLTAAGGQPGTPVSEAMGSAAWLRGVTANLAAEPSAILQRFLAAVPVPASAAATPSPAQQLSRRVRDMVASVVPEDSVSSLLGPFPLLQPSLSSERRVEAVKLYYHSLEAILVAEEKASGLPGVTALLASAKFHRALVACCVEVVAACYRMVACAFPKVLDVLRLKAFDLAKMIQSFVKSMDTLPKELKRHLFLIEEKIVEGLAWEPGSSLYNLLFSVQHEAEAAAAMGGSAAAVAGAAVAPAPAAPTEAVEGAQAAGAPPTPELGGSKANGVAGTAVGVGAKATEGSADATMQEGGAGAAAAAAAGSLPPPSPKRGQATAFSALVSSAKRARAADGSPHLTQPFTDPLPLGIGHLLPSFMPPGSSAAALYEFFRKVLKLIAFRLTVICDNFDFAPLDRREVREKVYETIEHALLHQTHLFYNRHVDQIMLSALYGYCKVHKLSQVSFREIITQYRKQPQSNQAIFRSVVIEQSNPGLQIASRADIIAFYNQVFVPAMKAFLLKADGAAAAAPTGPVPSHPPDGKPPLPPGAPGHHGHHDPLSTPTGLTADPSGGGGHVSLPPPGLPPLPPRSASQSPRVPKLPAASPGPLLVRPPLCPSAQPPRDSGRETDKGADPEARVDSAVKAEDPVVVAAGPKSVLAGLTAVGGGGKGDGGPCTPALGSAGGTRGGGGGSGSGGSGGKGSGPRTTKALDQRIPDCLAVLLQALDSQQNSDGEQEGQEEDGGDDEPHGQVPMGLTRSGRGSGSAGKGAGGRGRGGGGHDRRSTRLADRSSKDPDAMDADGQREDEPSSPGGVLVGRRHRTPSRRYGGN